MSMFRPVGPEAAHDLTADTAPVSGPRGATRASVSGAGCSRPELSAAFLSLRPNWKDSKCVRRADGSRAPGSRASGPRPAPGPEPAVGGPAQPAGGHAQTRAWPSPPRAPGRPVRGPAACSDLRSWTPGRDRLACRNGQRRAVSLGTPEEEGHPRAHGPTADSARPQTRGAPELGALTPVPLGRADGSTLTRPQRRRVLLCRGRPRAHRPATASRTAIRQDAENRLSRQNIISLSIGPALQSLQTPRGLFPAPWQVSCPARRGRMIHGEGGNRVWAPPHGSRTRRRRQGARFAPPASTRGA